MKRIMTMVVALAAALSISAVASAAPYSFDVSGAAGSVVTVSSFASVGCTNYPVAGSLCFTNPLSAGSTVNVDITGYNATLNSSPLFVNTATVLFGLVTITTDVDVTLSGATGTLSGNSILWSTPATLTTLAGSTLTCSDFGSGQPVSCGTLGLTAGTVYPISVLNVLGNTSSVTAPALGTWNLNAGLTSILSTDRIVSSTSNVAPNPPTGWYYFGADTGVFPVPEPGSMALVLLGLGGLALRMRKA
jgi:hypothetical protein